MPVREFPATVLGETVLADGFRYQRQPAIERTEMESGLARGRLYNSNPLARIPCQYIFTEFQVAFFEAWLQTVANRGASWFTINLPLEGGTYREVLARVVGEPIRATYGTDMKIGIEYEIHDSIVLPDGIVDLILEFGSTGVQEMAAALEDVSLQPFFDAWAVGFGA